MKALQLALLTTALGSLVVPTTACRSHASLPWVPVVPPLAIPEPLPPTIPDLPPEMIAADLPDQCPPSSNQTGMPYEPQVYFATAGALPLVALYPDYPLGAGDRCVSGWAAFRFSVSSEGRVEDSDLVGTHPRGVFDGPSLTALKKWRYNLPTATAGELPSTGGCAFFLFHHPLHPLEVESVAGLFPIRCPFPPPVVTVPHGPFPRGPLEALIPDDPFIMFE